MNNTDYPNIVKLAQLIDWLLGLVFSLIWVLLVIIIVFAII